jgi:hypothetical protein
LSRQGLDVFGSRPIAVTIPHAMRLSGVGRSLLYERIKSGELETVKVGKRKLVLFASLERLLTPKPRPIAAVEATP